MTTDLAVKASQHLLHMSMVPLPVGMAWLVTRPLVGFNTTDLAVEPVQHHRHMSMEPMPVLMVWLVTSRLVLFSR